MALADGKVVIKIDADSKGFETDLNKVEVSANELSTKALKGLAAGTAAVATAFVASATAAAMAGSAYETAFAQTMTIMDQNVVSAEDMSAAIIDLSNDTGTAATQLSDSVYNAISATGDTANAVSLVADASKLATAGFADEGDALGVLTTITNAYGMSASEASAISDSLIQTQNLGVTTVGQLASSMGKAIATASAYSIDLNNLESAYVSLTKAGISTEESTTYLSSMFNELGDSGSTVAGIIQNKTGKSFGQLMKSGATLGDVLEILLDSVNGDTEALMNLWGSAEAGKAASAIAGQGVKTFNANLDQLRNSTGLTEKAYQTMANTLSFQTDKLKTRITNLGTAVYQYFDDSLTEGVSSLSDAFLELTESVTDGELSGKMQQISDGVADLISTGADLVADVLPKMIDGAVWILDNSGTIVTAIGGVTAAVVAYKVAVTAATITVNPFGAVISGAILAGTGFLMLAQNATKVTESTQAIIDSNEKTAATTDQISTALDTLRAGYQATSEEIQGAQKTNDDLITSLLEMIDAYDGTAGSAAVIEEVISDLNSAVPGLNLSFDEQAGSLNRSEEAMRALNEEYAAQQQYEAARTHQAETEAELAKQEENVANATKTLTDAQDALNTYTDTYGTLGQNVARGDTVRTQRIGDLTDAVDDAQKILDDANDTLAGAQEENEKAADEVKRTEKAYSDAADAADEFSDETEDSTDALDDQAKAAAESKKAIMDIANAAIDARYSGGDLREEYENLSKQLDGLREGGDETAIMLAEQKLQLLDVAATTQELSSYAAMGLDVGTSLVDMSAYLVSAGVSAEEFASGISSMRDSVVNNFQSIKNENALTANEIIKNLGDNLKAQQQWSQNLSDMWSQAYANQDTQVMAFINYIAQMGPEYAGEVQSFANAGYGKLQEAASLWGQIGEQSASDYASGIWMQQYVAGDAGEGLGEDALNALKGVDYTGAGQETGQQWVSGFGTTDTSGTAQQVASGVATDLTAQAPIVEAAGQQLGLAAHTAIANIGWTDLGAAIAQGLANGISSNSAVVSAAVVTVSDGIKSDSFTNAGKRAGTALATGLKYRQSALKSAATVLTNAVTTTWSGKSSAFHSTGQTAAKALQTGLTNGRSGVQSAGQNLAAAAINGFSGQSGKISAIGLTAAYSLASGISSGRGSVTAAATNVAYAAQSAMRISGWYGLGWNIAQGVADGLTAGSYLITKAARQAARDALKAAKKELGVQSPSKVFREQVGMMIPAGMAQGIALGTPQAVQAVEVSADDLLLATRTALDPIGGSLSPQYISNISNISNSYHGGDGGTITLEAPVYLDGREIARASAKYTGRQMAYLEGL